MRIIPPRWVEAAPASLAASSAANPSFNRTRYGKRRKPVNSNVSGELDRVLQQFQREMWAA